MASIKDNTLTSVKEGSIVNFKAIAQTPLKSLRVNFTPIQQGEGDPSPENIRAIKGWTGVNVYNGTTIPVSWDSLGTVYGGYIDLISGEVWQTWEVASARWGDIKIGSPSTTTGYYEGKIRFTNKIVVLHSSSVYGNFTFSNVISKVIWNGSNTTPEHYYGGNENEKGVCYIYCNYDDNTIIQITAKLAEPVLIGTIDPITIKTLLGTNNIYSDADSVSVEYYNLESLDLYKQRFKANQPYLQTANGSVASFQTALKAPLKECKVYFEPVQDQGTPSPDNILPISGWTGFDLWRTGRNIIHKVGYSASSIISPTSTRSISNTYGTTLSTINPDESVTIMQSQWPNSNKSSYQNGYFNIIDDNLIFGHTYNISIRITNITNNPLNASLSDIVLYNPSGSSTGATKTVEGDRVIWKNFIYEQFESKPDRHELDVRICGMSFTISDIIVTEVNDSTSPYEPYNGTTTSITLSDTYYGGYVDLTSGEGKNTYKYVHLTGNENWYMEVNSSTVSNASYLASIRVEPTGQNSGVYKPAISNKLAPSTYWAPDLYCAVINTTSRVVIGLPQELSTKEAVNNWIQSIGGIDIVWESMFPTSFTISPTQLKTLKGINNIWSNTSGNIQTKYWTYGSLAKRKTFTWNQWVPQLISENWQSQNANYSTLSIDNNIATINIIQDVTAVYLSSMKSKKTNVPWILDHKYYIRQDINPSQDSDYVIIRYNSWVGGKRCLKDEWTTLKVVTTSITTASNVIYLGYCSVADQSTVGKVTKVKNPMIIDLTQMFGSGNEPTLQEFESLCARNGIDLTQYQPYDEGSTVNWYV